MENDRSKLSKKDIWNVEKLFESSETWEKEFLFFMSEKKGEVIFPEIAEFVGKIKEGEKTLLALLNLYFEKERTLSKLYTYAHLRHDEDVAYEKHKDAFDRVSMVYYLFSKEMSWIEPEILQLNNETLEKYTKSEALKDYRIYLEKIAYQKPHTRSIEIEEMAALAVIAMQTPQKAFGLLNNADLTFEDVIDAKGNKHKLTHSKYSLYLQSTDRVLRKSAFTTMQNTYINFENTITELIQGQVQKSLFVKRIKNYASCLEQSLYVHQIDTSVYHSLVKTVRSNLDPLYDYLALRKQVLGLEKLHLYDLYAPITEDSSMKFSYDEAKKMTLESVEPLGEEYQAILAKGLGEDRWVDVYETSRKRSGAYSSGCYDSVPYILLNFEGTLRDCMTLTHEAGHSMHSYLSHKNQPYPYSHYPIFVAEVASTFNEELLFRHLLKNAKNKKEKISLISGKLDDIRSTLFRQTMFAEFELKIHELAEKGATLSAPSLKKLYHELNQDYYGKECVIDEEVSGEYLRIPHFYYNFYVYQYATGISAALTLVEKILREGSKARDAYLKFLSSGSSKYPIDLLKTAGVDMTTSEPVITLIKYFSTLVQDLKELLQK